MKKTALCILFSLLLISAVSASDVAANIGDRFIVFDPELLNIDDFELHMSDPLLWGTDFSFIWIIVEEYEKIVDLYELNEYYMTTMYMTQYDTAHEAQQSFNNDSETISLSQNITISGYNAIIGISTVNSPKAVMLLDEKTKLSISGSRDVPYSVNEFLQFLADLEIHDGSIQEMIQRSIETET